MKTVAAYALHYGKEYLAWSVRSIDNVVDEIVCFYTPSPSFGHGTTMQCPDTEEELIREVGRFATKPIHWRKGTWHGEGRHRDELLDFCKERDADIALIVDADEVWDQTTALEAVAKAAASEGRYRNVRVNFIHFWRSLGWVCRDAMCPVRAIDLHAPIGAGDVYLGNQFPVLHFGYAQSEALMRYKWSCHGHQPELRDGWLEKFSNWKPGTGDVHPTCLGIWNPEPVTQELALATQRLLDGHPYREFDIIR